MLIKSRGQEDGRDDEPYCPFAGCWPSPGVVGFRVLNGADKPFPMYPGICTWRVVAVVRNGCGRTTEAFLEVL